MKKILSVFLVILCVSGMRAQALWGTTGLLRMPTAEMQKDKTFMFGGNILDKHPMPPRWNNESYTYTYNYYIGITIFPWLEVAYSCTLAYIIHSGFISGYQNRYGDNLKPPTNVYHRMTA